MTARPSPAGRLRPGAAPSHAPVRILDPRCVAKTFPDYFETLLSVCQTRTAQIPVLCIDGPTASGKGTVAAAVAQQLGYHFLAVKADNDEHARSVAAIGREHHAERAQYYGRFIVEELIEHPTDTAQVAESPARGLDAQTPSGQEEERARLRPADE